MEGGGSSSINITLNAFLESDNGRHFINQMNYNFKKK